MCQHFGLNVELRASRYLALYDGNSKALAKSFDRISKTAKGLIDAVTGRATVQVPMAC